ncbi:MAG: lipoyl domain-containing protein [Gammaproteobacteria bacterium]|nr:lipoyl domain-containing protein [Gammaproteobacteria bacterium]MBV1732524.1 lipoyl domain-containing protein [Hydrogenophaga sp.]
MNITLPDTAWEGVEPSVGALVDRWLVQEGDTVRQGQPLVTVVLVKASQDIGAPMNGRVTHILVTAGHTFHRGQPIATLERLS